MKSPLSPDQANFEAQVVQATVPVLVVFTAVWCAPCKWLTPYLDELVETAGSSVLIHMVDVDRSPQLSERYRIASVPTVILMKGGKEVDRSLGVEPERLRAWARSP